MRAIAEFLTDGGGSNIVVEATYYNGPTFMETYGSSFAGGTATSRPALIALANTAITAYATLQGYTLSEGIIWPALQDADVKSFEGTTQRNLPISVFKSATVASGVAVFNLTVDGTSTGASLFPNGVVQDSVNMLVNDATAGYQLSYAFSNSNKTVTVTANKTSFILGLIQTQAAANGAVVKLSAFGY